MQDQMHYKKVLQVGRSEDLFDKWRRVPIAQIRQASYVAALFGDSTEEPEQWMFPEKMRVSSGFALRCCCEVAGIIIHASVFHLMTEDVVFKQAVHDWCSGVNDLISKFCSFEHITCWISECEVEWTQNGHGLQGKSQELA